MKIKEILKKQGKIYKNLTSNKTIQNYNRAIEKPKPVKLVPYGDYQILEQECKAITELEKLLDEKAVVIGSNIFNKPKYWDFAMSIENNQIIYLRIRKHDIESILGQVNKLTNLKKLSFSGNQITEIKNLDSLTNLEILNLSGNKITEIKNLDTLTNLQVLYLGSNNIKEIKNLDNFTNLKELYLSHNQIQEIKNLDNLINLQYLYLSDNQITEKKGLDKLVNLKSLYLIYNQITKIKNLNKLTNLKWLHLDNNPIKNKKAVKKLVKKGMTVTLKREF